MSMFGAVDLSSFAPASKPAGPSSGASAQASSDSGGAGGSAAALVVDVDASSLRDVAELSARVPVIVVLHSPRSQVSTDLAAVLERLAGQYAGRFQVARVNVDAAPEVAQALQAQAVPTVVALIAGQPVPMFQGTVPEDQLRSILDQLLEVAAANGVSGTIAVDAAAGADARSREPEETEVERAAREALEAGDFASYRETKDAMAADYADTRAWQRRAWVNITRSGRFSSDRTISDYAREVWKIDPEPIA